MHLRLSIVTLASILISLTAATPVHATSTGDTVVREVTLTPDQGSLRSLLATMAQRARSEQRTPIVDVGAPWCVACHQLDTLVRSAAMRDATRDVYIIHLNLDYWHDELDSLGVRTASVPVMFAINAAGKPVGTQLTEGTPDNVRQLFADARTQFRASSPDDTTGTHPSSEANVRADVTREVHDTLHLTEVTGAQRPVIAGLEGYLCFTYKYGWVFAKETDTAGLVPLFDRIQVMGDQFERYFGRSPGRGAVVISADNLASDTSARTTSGTSKASGTTNMSAGIAMSPKIAPELRKAGARWVMPYVSRRVLSETFAQQLASQVDDPNMAAAALSQMMESFDGVMYHELGHAWFSASYWPGSEDEAKQSSKQSSTGKPDTYGSPAADWLDESAAILMEDSTLTTPRLQKLHTAYRANPNDPHIVPLDTLFVMPHGDEDPANGKLTNGVNRLSVLFYEQCLSVANFLLEHSTPDHPIFGSLAEGAQKGESMAQWLQKNGARYHLPTKIRELDTQWREWLKRQE